MPEQVEDGLEAASHTPIEKDTDISNGHESPTPLRVLAFDTQSTYVEMIRAKDTRASW